MFFRDQHHEKKRMDAVSLRGRRWTTTQVLQILGQPGWRGELWRHCWLLSVPNWVKRAGLCTPILLSHSMPAVQAQVWTQGKDSAAEEDHEGNSGRNMKNDCWPLLLSEGWKGSLSLMLILHGHVYLYHSCFRKKVSVALTRVSEGTTLLRSRTEVQEG